MKIYLKAYTFKNLGDDIFLKMITERYPQVEFITQTNESYHFPNLICYKKTVFLKVIDKIIKKLTSNKHSYEHFLMKQCDATVLIGGSMFIENEKDPNYLFNLGAGKPYFILGSNFGPYKTEVFYQKIYQLFREAEDVCLREKQSYQMFNQLPNVRLASDIVFSLDTSNIDIKNSKKVVISVIECGFRFGDDVKNKYEETIADLILEYQNENYQVNLISFCEFEKDSMAIDSIIQKVKTKGRSNEIGKYIYRGNIEEALNYIADSSIILGTRFHANILGLLFGKKVIPIVYSDKTLNLLDDLNITNGIIDIRNLEKINIDDIKKTCKIINIDDYAKNSQEQFIKLDEFLEKRR